MDRSAKNYRRLRFRKSRIEKRYMRMDLLVDDRTLEQRTALIEELSIKYPKVPRTSFHWEDDTLVLTQDRIRKQPLPEDRDQLIEPLEQLSGLFQRLSPHIVHGDITRKNLVFDGQNFWPIDWEPALYQQRNGRPTLLYTEPYISLRDRRGGTLSTETDKLSYFYTCFRLLHGRNPIPAVRELATRRQTENICMTPIPEADLVALSWDRILLLVQEIPNWSLSLPN